MRKTLIIGATSAIAQATARRLAEAGDALYLLGRNDSKLAVVADDLRARGAAQVTMAPFEALDYASHQTVIEQAAETLGGIDLVLIAYGTLADQKAGEASFDAARRDFETNALSVMSFLTYLANRLEAQKRGTIAVISSVAGDRGRKSNYIYGTAKGALTLFLQGLRARLHRSGVRVLTIKPGFVDTPMTVAFPKGVLWIQPDRAAADIHKAIEMGKEVAYVPWFWRYIMFVIRTMPEPIFKRFNL